MLERVLDHMPELLESMMLVMVFVLVSVTLVAGVLAFEFAGTAVDLGATLGFWYLEAEFAHAAGPGRLHLLHGLQSGEAGGLHLTVDYGADAAEDGGAGVFAGSGGYGGGLDFCEEGLKIVSEVYLQKRSQEGLTLPLRVLMRGMTMESTLTILPSRPRIWRTMGVSVMPFSTCSGWTSRL